jgi:F420H(2)-dependent quinone reductase
MVWFTHNLDFLVRALKSSREIRIEIGDDTIDVHAKEVKGREHDILYAKQASIYTRFADHQRNTKRIIWSSH